MLFIAVEVNKKSLGIIFGNQKDALASVFLIGSQRCRKFYKCEHLCEQESSEKNL
nr:MAG TPA_asm: hypothetical protein [Bacteriophage sp.]